MNTTPAPTSILSPVERLRRSRELMRQSLVPTQAAPAEHGLPWSEQLSALRNHPMLSSAIDALQRIWESHPWRPITQLTTGLAREALQPVARQHPVLLVLAAMALGSSLVWFRPARQMIKTLLFRGVVAESVLGLAQQPFVGSLVNMAISWLHQLSTPEKHTAP
jgi:hypothetical protein